ncbi:hypothetical protein [Riemerella anatipestifer]|uniref:hypothetical protein n=1 Tax=Riemerella anatipestifer TaxID=34085 RepID=UPI00137272DA|nr:hypothetical protein [Riemerella anatipestifer]MBT0549577.1 hypothetical protein [Riemerella anatipestifer]MBT0556487.1 hypothetical protein [Riemerella anatipestifer]MBT0560395.1 hypothetical protein [Riemerella anatipestifer]NAV16842.1 hypothetical protein [Riemerella anatipestifer]UZX27718.1 hypothetical protein OIS45_10200 [Riemerella anatipestifer]
MKKFISLVALATLLFSAVSCREAEQISDLQEDQNLSAKVMNVSENGNFAKDSIYVSAANSETNDPRKDGQGW